MAHAGKFGTWVITAILVDFPIPFCSVTVPLLTNKILPLSTKPVLSVLCVPAFSMQQAISVWVRDPRIQKNDFWHAYIDYEICLHVSMPREWQIVSTSLIFFRHVWVNFCILDWQCVPHQENLKSEKEVQWVCVAETKTSGKCSPDVSTLTVTLCDNLKPLLKPFSPPLRVKLPELPPKNPFFSLNSAQQITERMKGLQTFLEQ